ncbi:aminoglycoside phosphotransferase family protein, partial [Pseudoalteromonas piscicida]
MCKISFKSFLDKHISEDYSTSEITHGANSQVFLITTSNACYVLKHYLPTSIDSDHKLKRELSFLLYLSSIGCTQVPSHMAHCLKSKLLLMTYIPGEHVIQPKSKDTRDAFMFIENINKATQEVHLGPAKDAVSTLSDFANLVNQRLIMLANEEQLYPNYKKFIQDRVEVEFKRLLNENKEINWNTPLGSKVISPSDFGFHNMLLTDKKIFFYDFEYAGYDSVWKLVADFFSQPQIEVPIEHFSILIDMPICSSIIENPNEFNIAFNLTRLKWCFIIGGNFLHQVRKRKEFANS